LEAIRRRLRSEVYFVDVDVTEQEETARAVTAAVVDQQRVTTEPRSETSETGRGWSR
jgi:hypothetical protein